MKKMRSYMTDKGFAVKAMRYGEMVAVFVVRRKAWTKILAETGLELSEEERKSLCIDLFLVSYDLYKKWGGYRYDCSRKSDNGTEVSIMRQEL